MSLPAQYSLMHSEYNDFLEALIGEGRNGMPLSVISAFARRNIDPWREAERLSGLSREGAVAALAVFIRELPDGAWLQTDTQAIATRLTALLPRHGAAVRLSRKLAGKNGAPAGVAPTDAAVVAARTDEAAPHKSGPVSGAPGRAGPGIPDSGQVGQSAAPRHGGGGRGVPRLMTIALLILMAAAAAAWYDATFNRDSSLVQPSRDTTRQP